MAKQKASASSIKGKNFSMRIYFAALLLLTIGIGIATILLEWRSVPFIFSVGVMVLLGVPITTGTLRTRLRSENYQKNDGLIDDFERHFNDQ